jgi:hypothetical protein
MRDALFTRRLEGQFASASRRLQELVFECVGEYEKARRRAIGRSSHLRSDFNEQRRQADTSLRWQRFSLRLTQDWQGLVRASYVDPRGEDWRELSAIAARAVRSAGALGPSLRAGGTALVRLDPGPGAGGRRRPAAAAAAGAHWPVWRGSWREPVALADVLWRAAGRVDRRMRKAVPLLGYARAAGQGEVAALGTRARVEGEGGSSKEGVRVRPLTTLLSSEELRWLLAGEAGQAVMEPVNARVYYCVEERALRQGQGQHRRPEGGREGRSKALRRAGALCACLEGVYVDPGVGLQAALRAEVGAGPVEVHRALQTHRQISVQGVQGEGEQAEALAAFPDVLQVSFGRMVAS